MTLGRGSSMEPSSLQKCQDLGRLSFVQMAQTPAGGQAPAEEGVSREPGGRIQPPVGGRPGGAHARRGAGRGGAARPPERRWGGVRPAARAASLRPGRAQRAGAGEPAPGAGREPATWGSSGGAAPAGPRLAARLTEDCGQQGTGAAGGGALGRWAGRAGGQGAGGPGAPWRRRARIEMSLAGRGAHPGTRCSGCGRRRCCHGNLLPSG